VHGDRDAEPIAAPWNRLDIDAVLAPVMQRIADLLDAEIHALVEVDEGPFGPEVTPNVVA
jgi:hypothetical protein